MTYAVGKKALLFDKSFARDFDKWKQAWDQTGILANEIGRTEQGVGVRQGSGPLGDGDQSRT